MKLALIHPDAGVARGLARALSLAPDLALAWTQTTVVAATEQPLPELLLVSAMLADQRSVRDWSSRGCAVAVLVPSAGSCTDAVYAALDAGAIGHAVLEGADAWPVLLARVRRWSTLVPRPRCAKLPPLIAVGASAGGPQALKQLLAEFTAPCPAAVVVALHYAGAPILELATWLQQDSALRISVARAGEVPCAGRVVMADSGAHLQLAQSGQWELAALAADDPVCPSIDRLFLSLARHPSAGAAALLTGMGQDGAAGLLALRRASWFTVAQDANSSRVYGMPRAAAEAGAAVSILPLRQIPGALLRAISAQVPA